MKFYEDISEIPELEGWWTVPQVAVRVGVTRQRLNQMVQEGKFPHVHRINEVLLVPDADIDDYEAFLKGRPRKVVACATEDERNRM